MLHAATAVRWVSHLVGLGVFATERIPRGTIVWTQDATDLVLEPNEVPLLDADLRRKVGMYGRRDHRGRVLVCRDAGRLVNHSCEPNLRGIGPFFQVARRSIDPGDEITFDYGECDPSEPMLCACGSVSCRVRVTRDDRSRLELAWRSEVQRLLPLARQLDQPLWPYLVDPAKARAFLEEQLPIPAAVDFGTPRALCGPWRPGKAGVASGRERG